MPSMIINTCFVPWKGARAVPYFLYYRPRVATIASILWPSYDFAQSWKFRWSIGPLGLNVLVVRHDFWGSRTTGPQSVSNADYYKTNCKASGEDAFWKNSTCPSSKWPPIGHYSLSHGRYLVNRARWLDHYCETKCEISDEDASWKNLTWSNLKWPPFRPLFIFTWLIFGKPC